MSTLHRIIFADGGMGEEEARSAILEILRTYDVDGATLTRSWGFDPIEPAGEPGWVVEVIVSSAAVDLFALAQGFRTFFKQSAVLYVRSPVDARLVSRGAIEPL